MEQDQSQSPHPHKNSSQSVNKGGKKATKLYFILLLAVIFVSGSAIFLIYRKNEIIRDDVQRRKKREEAGERVDTAEVKLAKTERSVLLSGETRPYYSVILYARVSGYLDRLFVDIGDSVKKNQLLAHVESPEQEQAYHSALANAINKKRIARRMKILLKRKLVSLQQEQQAVSDAQIAEANLRTQKVIRGYQNILAPFDGAISNRYVDPGALLQNASTSQAASSPLFTLTDSSRIRVFIYIDQKNAPYAQIGDPVKIFIPSQSGESYTARVTQLAAELDPKTRTLLAELIVDNSNKKIVPGTLVRVELKIRTPQFMELPIQSLVFRGGDPYVSLIKENKLYFQKIELVENTGESILIRSGIEVGQVVALNAGSRLKEGEKVAPVYLETTHIGVAGQRATGKSP